MSSPIRITSTHVKRAVLICFLAGIFIWFAVPSWFHKSNTLNLDNELGTNPKKGPPPIRKELMYQSEGSLRFRNRKFYLNNSPIRIFSGAVHYFRILPQQWNNTFMKMKACGLNTVETYVPWNFHEPHREQYTFKGNHGLLNIRDFILTAKANGLYVILRPGPYICSEWDFGGLPSWLLQDHDMKVRTNYPGYIKAVEKYFSQLLPFIADLQYGKGGPIIAYQLENEFGSYTTDVQHIKRLKEILLKNGVVEMFFTSDGAEAYKKRRAESFYDALPTANFGDIKDAKEAFNFIKSLSDKFPLFVMEFWDGWFDHWGKPHKSGPSLQELEELLTYMIKEGASINFYMFHGGTNFGFMNGANYFPKTDYMPTVSSYDYVAPLTEAGDVTEKYHLIRKILLQNQKYVRHYSGEIPEKIPKDSEKAAYGTVKILSFLAFEHMLEACSENVKLDEIFPMEHLPSREVESSETKLPPGQSYGYILYRKILPKVRILKLQGIAQDRMQVFWNGKEIATYDWNDKSMYKLDLSMMKVVMDKEENTLDLLVENMGRVNYVKYGSNRLNEEYKGIIGDFFADGQIVKEWMTYPLEFTPKYLNRIWNNDKYRPLPNTPVAPALYSAEFKINGTPRDTFLSMEGWKKGVVFLNDFNLGRYWKIGPQKTLYVPASLLYQNKRNTIRIFEQHAAGTEVKFVDKPVLE